MLLCCRESSVWLVSRDRVICTCRQGHVGSDQDVEAHIELAARDEVRVGHVALHHVGLRAVFLCLLPPTVGLPLANLAQLGHNKYPPI